MRITSLAIALPILLAGSQLCAHAALADVAFVEMAGRLEVSDADDGGTTVSLLAGGPLGLGGVAAGRVTNGATEQALWISGEAEVSGISPTPFFPVGEGDVSGIDPTPFAPHGERVLMFSFDSAGDYSGIQPQPFHVFLLTPTGVKGELLFDDVVAQTGSLILSGVILQDESGAQTEIPTFTITALLEPVPVLPAEGVVVLAGVLLVMGLAGVAVARVGMGRAQA